jgi:hypothetical protein
MLVIQLLIFSMKKEVHSIVYFLQEDAVQQALIANIIIKYLLLKIANVSIKQKISLEEQDLVLLEKT